MEAEVKQVKPLSNYTLVEVLEKENKTESGIQLSLNETVYVPYCRILKKGKGCSEDIQEDRVYMYNEHAGTKVNFKGKPYLFVKENDLYAEIEE